MAVRLPKSVFIHVAKTGGKWVIEALSRCGLIAEYSEFKHRSWQELQASARYADWKGLKSFAFVRHPVGWYRSYWAFKMMRGWSEEVELDRLCKADDFEVFVRNCLEKYPGNVGRYYREYTAGVEFVGRFEILRESLIWILTQIGEEFDPAVIYEMPEINTSARLPQWDRRCRYSPQLLQDVVSAEADAIEAFGYATRPLQEGR